MTLILEGDVSSLSDKQIDFIKGALEKLGYTNNILVFEPASQVGDNYAANVQRITVKAEDSEDFKMIAKIAPCEEAIRFAMNTTTMFSNETAMYRQVLPKFAKLQIAADISEDERLRYPKCYGCLTEEPHEVILLEDLRCSDYVMLDRFRPLNSDTVKLILKNFAILHSLSFVLKNHEPGIYEILRSKLVDIWSSSNDRDDYKTYLVEIQNRALDVLDEDKYKNAIRGLMFQTSEQISKIKKYEAHSKHLAIQQGDAWTNNLMFKLQDEKPTDCIMIDYQVSKESNPASDILYMTFTCTDHSTRSKHYQEWISYYHEKLEDSLSNYGMKANLVYPREQLDADLKRYSKLYFGTSILLFDSLSRKPEETAKTVENIEVKTLSDDTIKLYRSKLKDLIDSCREFGYIA